MTRRHLHPPNWVPLFRAVIYRALFDALGFTGSNNKETQKEHVIYVAESREWFLNEEDSDDFFWVCVRAELDPYLIRKIAKEVIYARTSGDHTGVPEFWAKAFKRNRAPALSWLEKQVNDPVDESEETA